MKSVGQAAAMEMEKTVEERERECRSFMKIGGLRERERVEKRFGY